MRIDVVTLFPELFEGFLAIGMVGAELPVTASPVVSLAPLGGASPLAPSALLIGEP